ncbi:molybdopterin molybdotransferase MoeA [Amycolatopsis sp. CA-230715]|uniref:molybdopterin molybdotransferase MoeA n=1 Tax=Amycolatopsis sp. CA-230715 TaxID=2745196 RepID=UPI001C020D45|nr:gephyrin-like molybdotransferase Glp [Amycolatopsis sp. CA-230715]QWF81608.1 Molybdopterin molybdenumtransferase 2 [Amycolatopsis sp. CA-230715]
MIGVDEYRATVTALLGDAAVAVLPLAACDGLVLAEDVRAGVSLPPFDNSAMDGYAVRSVDVVGASRERPVELPVAADIPAGLVDVPALLPGTAHRIMTGAPVPVGADSVVMVENTDAGSFASAPGDVVRVHAPSAPGTHLRRTGEDVVRGTVALPSGSVLGPAQLGLAAAVGIAELPVRVPPRVLVVSTGSELVTPPDELRHGQIYESNSVMLAAALSSLGCRVEVVRAVVDDVAEFRAVLEPKLAAADLLITSGGVSAGAYEVVKDALTSAGVEFGKVAMQPGGPQGCGRWNGVPVVTLPGNPVSVLVSFEAFLRPALLTSLGHAVADRTRVRARLTESLNSPKGKRQFRRGFYSHAEGEVTGEVGPRGGPGSHLLAAFTQANCLIVLGEDVTEAAEGDEVDVLLL